MTEIRECGEADSSRSVRLKSGKHEIQTTGCIVEQIADEKRTNVKDFVS